MRTAILLGFLFSYLPLPSPAQQLAPDAPSTAQSAPTKNRDFNQTVFPLTTVKARSIVGSLGFEAHFGTGFCVDPECRFVGTNYHVAVMARPRRIRGERIIERYLATGPSDEGATLNEQASGPPLRYTLSRDLAVFQLRRPLAAHHGIAFSRGDLQLGQEVDIYAYPQVSISPFRSLQQFHGTFKGETLDGLLVFNYELSGDKAIRSGASGGIVVDSNSREIVGILCATDKQDQTTAVAVSVSALADFVNKAQPFLAQVVFPVAEHVSAVSPDFYPKFVFAPDSPEALQRRSDEPDEIKRLRNKAQLLAASMRNYIAVQTFIWGSGSANNPPSAAAAYEVRVVDGFQRFRKYPDGKEERGESPVAPILSGATPADDWSRLSEVVGRKLGSRIGQAPDAAVNGQHLKVFQYYAPKEDGHCRIRNIYDFVFFSFHRDEILASYGEVWTDDDTNILRISEHCERNGNWGTWNTVVTFGWLKIKDEPPHLVPVTIATETNYRKKTLWCRGQFVNYREFVTRAKLETP